jgi:hypothetical protein
MYLYPGRGSREVLPFLLLGHRMDFGYFYEDTIIFTRMGAAVRFPSFFFLITAPGGFMDRERCFY